MRLDMLSTTQPITSSAFSTRHSTTIWSWTSRTMRATSDQPSPKLPAQAVMDPDDGHGHAVPLPCFWR